MSSTDCVPPGEGRRRPTSRGRHGDSNYCGKRSTWPGRRTDNCRDGAAPSGARLQDHVERGLRGAPHLSEATGCDDLAQPCLAGLCAERRTDLLRQRGRNTDHRRSGVEQPADWVQISARGCRLPSARQSSTNHPDFNERRTCAAAPAGSPISCRQSKKVTRSKPVAK